MTDQINLADGREGEAMAAMVGHELLFLGLPLDQVAALTYAARGSDPKALLALAKSILQADGLSYTARLASAEGAALMAALIGGIEERRFLAEVCEAQADVLTGEDRRFCLLQAMSVFETLRDDGDAGASEELERVRAILEAVAA